MDPKRARVLVVDDEEKFAHLVGRMLSGEHDIVVLTSAGEALAQIAAGARFDLILCDLMLPQVSGVDLYERLGVVAPELVARVVFMTGGAFLPRAEEFLERGSIPRLEKPFGVGELRRVVREQLCQGAADRTR